MSSTPTSTAAQPGGGPVSDGLSSLVLSKRYLSCARPPHLYRLEHDSGTATNNDPAAGGDANNDDGGGGDNNNDDDEDDEDCGWPSVGWCAPSPAVAAAVQARYEPSDVFTPLVFEEIRPAPSSSSSSSWMHHNMQPQQQRCATGTSGLPHRRPLQHLSTLPSAAPPPPPPPPERQPQRPSAVANKSSDPQRNHHNNDHHHHHQRHNDDGNGGNNKPGDLSWLVNFQVASIFESTASHGTAGRLFAGEWQEPETLKQQKKKKSEQKVPSKINRKPYRLPPSRLDKANKPGYTYTEMIHQALMEKKELPVAEIYQWISSHFPYFREDDERWKNSVRHNLSINPNFRKGRKSQGAGHYWRLCNTEESMGQREYTTVVEDERTASPHESSELEQACKYLEGELRREDSMDGVKIDPNISGQLENEIYTNSFLISSPSKYVNEQISMSNNHDFHSYSDTLLEESIDFQYYNL